MSARRFLNGVILLRWGVLRRTNVAFVEHHSPEVVLVILSESALFLCSFFLDMADTRDSLSNNRVLNQGRLLKRTLRNEEDWP
jgi:hypothetical protein